MAMDEQLLRVTANALGKRRAKRDGGCYSEDPNCKGALGFWPVPADVRAITEAVHG